MTDAPVTAAARRFSARVGDQRKDGSSKNPIGIRGAACTAAAGMASSMVNAISPKRAAFSTGDPPPLVVPSVGVARNRETVTTSVEGVVKRHPSSQLG